MLFILRNTSWAWATIGSLMTALSVLRLMQEFGGVDLFGLPARALEYYAGIVGVAFSWIPLPFGWVLPEWYKYLVVITGALASCLERTRHTSGLIAGVGDEPTVVKSMIFVVVCMLVPIVLVWQFVADAALAIYLITSNPTYMTSFVDTPRFAGLRWFVTFVMMIAIVIVVVSAALLLSEYSP